MVDVSKIADAIARQMGLRQRAYAPLAHQYDVCGVLMRALTLRDVALLQYLRNSYICGGDISVVDALQIAWILSDNYKPSARAQTRFTARLLADKLPSELMSAIGQYVDDMFLDSGVWSSQSESGAKPKPPRYLMTSLLVAEIAQTYHWSESDILAMPLPRMWQYLHIARERANPKYTWRQLSEHLVESDFIANLNRSKNGG